MRIAGGVPNEELIAVDDSLLNAFHSRHNEVTLMFVDRDSAEEFFSKVSEAIQHIEWRKENQ